MTGLASSSERDRPARLVVLWAWVAFALVWFGTLGARSLITADEGRYAVLSLNMLWSGDWITPRLNGVLYFEKPALQYWAGAIAYQLFGINEFAARFWPGLASLASVAVVAFSATRLWGREAGLTAALLAGSMVWIYANGHYLTLDAGLGFFLTLALCAFILAQRDEATPAERRHFMWLTWAAMAGAVLSKGLVGLVIPGATLVLYSLISRDALIWRRMQWLSGLVIFLMLAAPWFIAVSLRNPGYAEFFFIHEHFTRFLTKVHGREGAWWFFLPLLVGGLMPWTALLPAMLRQGWQRSAGRFQPGRVLLIWSVFVLVFFSASSSKLPSYILPMFPALALLGAAWIVQRPARSLRAVVALPLVLSLGLIVAAVVFARRSGGSLPPEILEPMARAVLVAAVVLLVGALLSGWAVMRERRLPAVAALAAGGLLAAAIGTAGHEAYGIELKSAKRLAAALAPHLEASTEVFTVRDYDQTLPFYLGRNVILVDYVDEFEFGQKAEPGVSIPSLEEFAARWQTAPRAAASIPLDQFASLQAAGLPMKEVFRDRKRVAVVKP